MSKDDSRTKEKLIKTVLHLLTIKSEHLLTIREIAKEAKVNSASISYYFGSKENLLAEASNYFWKEWNDLLQDLESSKGESIEKLKKYLHCYLNYILKYDGIFKGYIAKVISQVEYDSQVSENIKKMTDVVQEIIRKYTKVEDEHLLKLKVVAILSSISYPALLGKYGVNSLGLDIYDDELRKIYINDLVQSALNLNGMEEE